MKTFKKLPSFVFLFLVLVLSGFMLAGCGGGDEEEPADEEQEESVEEDDDAADTAVTDFSKFSDSTQELGSSKEDAEYTLTDIQETAMSGYHRFEFELDSDESDLPDVEARLISSGGYIQLSIDKVTENTSGLTYQESISVNKGGITSLYHEVSPSSSEAVFFEIGITEDATFYLHEGSGLSVLLDVRYPVSGSDEDDSGSSEAVEDPEDFVDSDITLTGTNTAGDVRINRYSWSVSGGALKFIFETSAASGNPIPTTNAEYDASAKTVTVTFGNVERDSVLGSDNAFEADLSGSVTKVTGSSVGGDSQYVFDLTGATTYRVYRNLSPNQVVVEISL